jgi:hypothetical protein
VKEGAALQLVEVLEVLDQEGAVVGEVRAVPVLMIVAPAASPFRSP